MILLMFQNIESNVIFKFGSVKYIKTKTKVKNKKREMS